MNWLIPLRENWWKVKISTRKYLEIFAWLILTCAYDSLKFTTKICLWLDGLKAKVSTVLVLPSPMTFSLTFLEFMTISLYFLYLTLWLFPHDFYWLPLQKLVTFYEKFDKKILFSGGWEIWTCNLLHGNLACYHCTMKNFLSVASKYWQFI